MGWGVDPVTEALKDISSDSLTEGIRVRAVAAYMPEQSNPDDQSYLFSYRITNENQGEEAARLLSRHWIIVDSDGERSDVRGPGVVGHTPRLEHSESFEYSSFCPLRTNFGTMEGSYTFERDNGDVFEVQIARFYLAT